MAASIVWFRQDLRLHDHPALHAAAARGQPLIALYILEPPQAWTPGAASRYWLHQSLSALADSLARAGQRLILRQGAAREVLAALCAECGADALYFNRRYEAHARAIDAEVQTALARCCAIEIFNGHLLFEPDAVRTASGGPYRVFTPYYRACLARPGPAAPLSAPHLPPPLALASLPLAELALEPRIDWAAGIRQRWRFGEHGAHLRFDEFVDRQLADYVEARDVPARDGTAGLSPHLAFGEISVRTLWHAVTALAAGEPRLAAASEAWRRQLLWRDFAYHLLHHFPHTVAAPFRAEYARFEWCEDAAALSRWQRGQTGFPLIDAGMRELWHTGYMHNRVRMLVASLLCKHLGIDWRAGARWFWDTLVDADLANNTLGWQWSAGCGADAAPYFRIFNPVSQSRKFDAAGDYIRRWVPERAALPAPAIHDPDTPAPGYPAPLIDLASARQRALARHAALTT